MSIKRIFVISTGSVRIHEEHIRRSWKPLLVWLLFGQRMSGPLPINVYVIEHDKGLVLFDTGQDIRSVTDSGYFPKGIIGYLYRKLATFNIQPEQTLTTLLQSNGHRPEDIRAVVMSHLHQDHIGGLAEIGSVPVYIAKDELATVKQKRAVIDGVMADHILLPNVAWKPIDFTANTDESLGLFTESHDMFGDGSLVLLRTPGHTPGSISLLIREEGRAPVICVGDLTYDVRLLEKSIVPGVGRSKQMRESVRAVLSLKQSHPNLIVAAAHDPAARGLVEEVWANQARERKRL